MAIWTIGLLIPLLLTLSGAAQGGTPSGGGPADLISLVLLMALFFGVFYFFLIRPERRRRRQHQELLASLKRGDKVITIGGICGTIKKIDKDRIWLEVEDGVTLKILKDSVVEKEKPS